MTYNSKNTGKENVNQGYSRREFIRVGAFTVGAAGALSICGSAPAQTAGKSKGLSLSMAGYNFDRTRALIDGRVKIEGCHIQFQESGIRAFSVLRNLVSVLIVTEQSGQFYLQFFRIELEVLVKI